MRRKHVGMCARRGLLSGGAPQNRRPLSTVLTLLYLTMAAWHRPPLGLPLEIPQPRRRLQHSPLKDRRPRPHRQRPLQLRAPPHKAQLMPPRHMAHPHSHRPTTLCWRSAQRAWPWCVMAQEILLGTWLGNDFVTTTVGSKRHRALVSYARVRAKR